MTAPILILKGFAVLIIVLIIDFLARNNIINLKKIKSFINKMF